LKDRSLNYGKLTVNYIAPLQSGKGGNVLILHDSANDPVDPGSLDVLRKFDQAGITLVIATYTYGSQGVAQLKDMAGAILEICTKEGLEKTVLVGYGRSATAIVYSLTGNAKGIRGAIAIQPDPDEEVFSRLYGVTEPIWFLYSQVSGTDVERAMFRYHDLTAGSRLLKGKGNANDIYIKRPSQFFSLVEDYINHAGT